MTARRLALPRRSFSAALLVAAAVSAEVAVVASPAFERGRVPVGAAVVIDLVLVVPLLCGWLLQSGRAGLRVAVLGAGLAGLLLRLPLRLLAVPIELLLVVSAVGTARRSIGLRGTSYPAEAIRAGAIALLGDNAAARAAAAEVAILWYALVSWGRAAPAGFSSGRRAGHGAVAFALGFATIAEGFGVHVLLSRWAPAAAPWVAGLHLYGLVWLAGDARAISLRPSAIEGGLLRLRLGLRAEADVPLPSIAAVELRGPRPGELRLRILGEPNVVLRLGHPIEVRGLFGTRRTTTALAVQLDDPESFAAALAT